MVPRRVPNTALRELMRQCGWSGRALADAINVVGAENDLTLRYDRTSIAHWLAGSCPSVVVATAAAEAFSRRLGRPVSLAETGLAGPTDTVARGGVGNPEDVVEDLVRLGDGGTGRRTLIYGAATTVLPDMASLAEPRPASGRGQVGRAEVQAATLMLSVFSESDTAFGGGRARAALSAYLATDVGAWLRASASPTIRARLCSAAARLAYLAGWMYFDDTLNGAAQHYYRIATRLAAEAGDAVSYAVALRGLSVQAHYLGHRTSALDLVEAADRQSRRIPPVQAAFVAGQHAVALAAKGASRAALGNLRRAEQLLDRADDTAVIGDYHVAALDHQRAEVLAALGDLPGAIGALQASLRHRPATERRARAVTTARLAELCMDTGRIDHAYAAWSGLLDDWPYLSSGRVEQAVQAMRSRLRPHSRQAGTHALLRRSSPGPATAGRPAPT